VCACSFCGCFLFRPALPINLGNFDHATGGIASNGSLSPWVTFAYLPWCFILRLFLPPASNSTRDFRNLLAQIVNNVVCFFVCLSVSTASGAGSLAHPSCQGQKAELRIEAATGVSTTAGAGEWDDDSSLAKQQ
jgi:hypothetical protein